MLDFKKYSLQKKSPQQRFLLVIGMLFLVVYLALGITIILWDTIPIQMEPKYRIAFGVLLIVYSFIRFTRYFSTENNEE